MTNYVYESAAQDYRLKSIARSGVIGAIPKMAYSTDAYRILNRNTEGGEQQSLRYDALDRLTGVVVSGVPNLIRNENYQYDATDNLTISAVLRLKDGNLFMKASEFNGQAMNRVKDETAFYNQKRAWVYDADGNVTSDGEAQYAWDAENRLKSVTKNGVTSTFAYDGLSRLHSRTENGQTIFYKWCESDIKPCAAYGSDGKPKTLYLAQGEYETANAGKRYYLRDHLGSVQDVVSDSGSSLWHGEYTAYGQLMAERGEAVNRPQFGYAGMMKHYASGLNLTRFRAYHPEKGRWLSADPIGFAGGRNLYGYVGGEPISRKDKLGLDYWIENGRSTAGLHQRVCVGKFGVQKKCISFAGDADGLLSSIACALGFCHGKVYLENTNDVKSVEIFTSSSEAIDNKINKVFDDLVDKSYPYSFVSPLGGTCRSFSWDVFKNIRNQIDVDEKNGLPNNFAY